MRKKKIFDSISLFFIISYTITIFTFSIGVSSINSQKLKMKKTSIDYNRQLIFQLKEEIEENELIKTEEIIKILESNSISTILKRTNNQQMTVETYLTINSEFYSEDMKNGEYFTKEDFKSKKEKAVFSNTFIGDKSLEILGDDGDVKIINFENPEISYEKEAKVTIPIEMFKNYQNGIDFNDKSLEIIINGEKENLEKTLRELDNYFSNTDYEVNVYNYMTIDREAEWKILLRTTILMIFVTLVNSIGISYLWIGIRKKEIILRKVVGATNLNVGIIFFKELLKIATIAIITSILFQFILSTLTGGYILDMNIKINGINIISSIAVTIGTSFITFIPFLIYLTKIEPAKMLREE